MIFNFDALINQKMKFLFFLVYKLFGWKKDLKYPKEAHRCVMIVAPHTTNWDFIFGVGAFYDLKIPARFAMKKEWFNFPFKWLISSLGGVPIDRKRKKNSTENISSVKAMANIFKSHDQICMTITPEGSRSPMDEWRTGFWHIAKLANVPICLGHLNYETKIAEISKVIIPTDFDKDLKEIMAFYNGKKGKYPEKFTLDHRYFEKSNNDY